MLNDVRDWKREDARERFDEVLNGAKTGSLQRIIDTDGIYEVTFAARGGERISDVLSRPGPERD